MPGPATTTTTTMAGAAALLSLAPFGVSLQTLMLGGACFFAGSCARTGLVLIKNLDGNAAVAAGVYMRQTAILLCTTPLAAVASAVVFLAAHVLNIQADAAFAGLLLVMGLRGPEGFTALMDMFSNTFERYAPKGKQP